MNVTWKTDCEGYVKWATVENSIAYVRDRKSVTAIDSQSGDELWQVRAEEFQEDVSPFLRLADEIAYISSGGSLRAVDAQTGEKRWSHTEESHPPPVPYIRVTDDTVLFGYNMSLSAIGKLDGAVEDTMVPRPHFTDSGFRILSMATANRTMFLGGLGGVVAKDIVIENDQIYIENRWNVKIEESDSAHFVRSVETGKDKLFIATIGAEESGVYCLDQATGQVVWKSIISEFYRDVTIVNADENGTVYLIGNGNTTAFDAETGVCHWELENMELQAVAEDSVYLYCSDGLCAINAKTTDVEWFLPLNAPDAWINSVAVTDEMTYIGATDGLYGVSRSTGSQEFHDNGPTNVVVAENEMVYVGRTASGDQDAVFYAIK